MFGAFGALMSANAAARAAEAAAWKAAQFETAQDFIKGCGPRSAITAVAGSIAIRIESPIYVD